MEEVMDIKKVIKKINLFIEVWRLEQADEEMQMIVCKEDIAAFKVAIITLRKQISKKSKWDDVRCPICLEKLQGYEKYCYECGQKLDWN